MTHPSPLRSHSTLAVALLALSAPAVAQTTLQGMGTSVANIFVTDMSPDGSAVVGSDGNGIYLWTTANPTFTLIDPVASWDCDVSNGGLFISATRQDPSNANNETAARWDASTNTWTFLGGIGGMSGTSVSSAYDISADGQVVCGLGWVNANTAHAFSWDSTNGMIDLLTMQGSPSSSRANAISADGSTIVGWDSDPTTGVWRAAKWVSQVESLIGCLDPADPINGPSESYAVSSNGAYIAGESSTGLYTPSFWGEMHAFRWDSTNGLIDLGTTAVDPWGWGTHNTLPSGISDDGRTVVGIAGAGFFGKQPFISREGSGMSYLQSYLVALGVPNAAAWSFSDVTGISSNGRVIVGNGYNPSFTSEPFRVELAPLSETYCTAKVNSQGCTPAIAASGMASATSTQPFTVSASNVLNLRSGLLFYGLTASSAPFQGGIKCVANPVARTPLQTAGGTPSGTDCTGTYSYDFNARIQSNVDAQLTVGALVHAQYWSRDAQSPSTTGLTNAVRFTVFP